MCLVAWSNILLLSHSFCRWVQMSSAESLLSSSQCQSQDIESKYWVIIWRVWRRILLQCYSGCWLNSISCGRSEVCSLSVCQSGLLLVSRCHLHSSSYASCIFNLAMGGKSFLCFRSLWHHLLPKGENFLLQKGSCDEISSA